MKSFMYGIVAILSVCFALVQGATLSVGTGQVYQTISAAVAASSNGDVILLNNETFSGDGNFNVDLSNKSLTIQGSTLGSSTINCNLQGTAFTGDFPQPATVTFNGISFQNCQATDGGAIHFHDTNNDTNSFVVEFVNCSFSGNQATGNGGAVAIGNVNNGVSSVSISGSTFFANQGNSGGALLVSSVYLIIQDSFFYNNSAVVSGGAITVRSGTISFMSTEIHHNSVLPGYGGAVYIGGGVTSDSYDSSFHHNTASYNYGGAWFVDHNAAASFESSTFYENSAQNAGAVCVKYSANLTAVSSSFVNNTASVYGGAIHGYQANSIVFDQSSITSNKANGGAAAYIVLVNLVTFTNSTVSDNKAKNYGDAMYCQDTDIDLQSGSVFGDGFQCGPECEADGQGVRYCPPVPDCSAEKKKRHDVEIVLIVFALLVALGITYFVYYFVGKIQEQAAIQGVPVPLTQHQDL